MEKQRPARASRGSVEGLLGGVATDSTIRGSREAMLQKYAAGVF